MRLSRVSTLCCAVLAAVVLSGCSVTSPSHVETGEIRVRDIMKTALLPATEADMAKANVAADDYARNGRSTPRLVVPYMKGKPISRMAAQRVGEAYKNAFISLGVRNLLVDYAETEDKEAARNAVLSYTATIALPPPQCMNMMGHRGAGAIPEGEKYSFGCGLKTAFSQQIADPEDLLGTPGSPDDIARRQGPMMENYMSGKTNAPLNGLNASTTGNTSVTGGGVSAGQPTSR